MNVNLLALIGQLISNIGQIKALSLWQLITLAAYTVGSGAATFEVSHDWKYAAVCALGFFVAHIHGQIQPSPKQISAADADKDIAKVETQGAAGISQAQAGKITSVSDYINQMERK